jgi:DNA topoisomerase-1
MEFKLGRGGIFMSCTRYPDCEGARQEDGSELKSDEPLGNDPEMGTPIFVKTGRFGPYVEMELPTPEPVQEFTKTGKPKKMKEAKKAFKRASVPAGVDLTALTLKDALHYLSLPRALGNHPTSGKPIIANIGRFGPYVGHDGEFRSLKGSDDPYTITLDRAVSVLAEPKRPPKGVDIVREVGKHPKTGKNIVLYKSKAGLFLKKGLRRIYLPESQKADELTPLEAAEYLK